MTCSTIGLDTGWSTSNTGYIYQATNNRYAVRAKATLNNGVTYSATLYVPDTDAFNAGSAAGAAGVTLSSIALNTSWSTSSTGYVYQTANNRYAVNVKATASNGNYSTQTLYVPASDAYNAGSAASAISTGEVIATDASNYQTYSSYYNVSDANAYITTNYKYARIQLKNTAGTVLSTIRVRMNRDADTSGNVTVSTVTAISTDSSNYTTYDFAVSRTAGTMYTSGSYMYGRATIALSNNVEKTLRFRVPASSSNVTSISVERPTGGMDDWIIENNHVNVGVNLSAKNGSTVLATDTGQVNVDDIVNFWVEREFDHIATLTTGSSNYTTYDNGYSWGSRLYNPTLSSGGSSVYGRIGVYNGENQLLSTIRMALSLSVASASTSSDYSDYYTSGGQWYLKVHVKNGSTEIYQTGINVQHAVDYGAQQGGGATTPITLRCTNKASSGGIATTWTFQITSTADYPFVAGTSYNFYY